MIVCVVCLLQWMEARSWCVNVSRASLRGCEQRGTCPTNISPTSSGKGSAQTARYSTPTRRAIESFGNFQLKVQ